MRVPEEYRLREYNDPSLGTHPKAGNNGFFIIPHHRITDYYYNCKVSDGSGWEHVSITLSTGKKGKEVKRCPTWEEMCYIKNVFFGEEVYVMQFHPGKSDYVNMHEFCLHLWRPTDQTFPIPHPMLVGVKQQEQPVDNEH